MPHSTYSMPDGHPSRAGTWALSESHVCERQRAFWHGFGARNNRGNNCAQLFLSRERMRIAANWFQVAGVLQLLSLVTVSRESRCATCRLPRPPRTSHHLRGASRRLHPTLPWPRASRAARPFMVPHDHVFVISFLSAGCF